MTIATSRVFRSLAATTLLCAMAATASAAGFSSLEERMSAAEFRAAGLDKLTPEELAALNTWLRERGAGSSTDAYVPPAPAADRTGFRDAPEGAIVSRIAGPFTGWTGKTRFTLENGQVWEQIESGSFGGISLDSPTVTIEPGFFGSWMLRVEGYNKRVRVKRVQ